MLLSVRDLGLRVPDRAAKPAWGPAPMRELLRDISFDVAAGESIGLVGESGSGKTSLGRCIVRLYEPTAGSLTFDGIDITHADETTLRPMRQRFQMIFQDPQSSLNPRRRIGDIIAQPLVTFGIAEWSSARRRAAELLERVGLAPAMANRYCHQLSGGQRQRIGIARAIALEPALVLADEIVSGLDVSTQAQIIELLKTLKTELKLALIFVSHDLSVVRAVCENVMVMRNGEIVEAGATRRVFSEPQHPYTRALLDAIPLPIPDRTWLDAPAGVPQAGEASEAAGGSAGYPAS